MSADILRRAAALMRERATAASPGPWCTEPDTHAGRVWVTLAPRRFWGEGDCEPIFDVRPPEKAHKDQRVADAAHIAAMHPIVALAVADWLDYMAAGWKAPFLGPGATWGDQDRALAVARAYPGEDS